MKFVQKVAISEKVCENLKLLKPNIAILMSLFFRIKMVWSTILETKSNKKQIKLVFKSISKKYLITSISS